MNERLVNKYFGASTGMFPQADAPLREECFAGMQSDGAEAGREAAESSSPTYRQDALAA